MELLAPDIDPHQVGADVDVRVAGQAEARQIEQRGGALVGDPHLERVGNPGPRSCSLVAFPGSIDAILEAGPVAEKIYDQRTRYSRRSWVMFLPLIAEIT